nr:hypothetical protein [Tanacetum cinerariifolium]
MALKLVVKNHLWALSSSSSTLGPAFATCRQKLHESAYEKAVEDLDEGDLESAYEKEVEDEVDLEVSPVEEMTHKPEEYWEPDPDTGVFIPAGEQNSEDPAVTCTTEETILDEKVFIRPQEDIEPPLPESFTGEIPPVDPFA